MYLLLIFKIYYKGNSSLRRKVYLFYYLHFYTCFRQYFELENLRKRHIEELKNCIKTISSEGLQPTILYEALSPLSNSSKLNFRVYFIL